MCDNHTHEHEHAHTHEHAHVPGNEAAHSHTHDDPCCHEHAHGHTHPHVHADTQPTQSSAENLALLKYMLEHNQHHGEDLHELYHALETAGNKQAAAIVSEALHFFDHGNAKLAEALKLLGGE